MQLRNPIVIASSLAILAVAIAAWRYVSLTRNDRVEIRDAQRATQDSAKSAQKVLRSLEPTSIDVETMNSSVEQWRDILTLSSPLIAIPDISNHETLRTELLDEAASFLWHRVGDFDIDEYILWRVENGYRLHDLHTLRTRYRVPEWYETVFGRPPSDDATSESLFRDLIVETPGRFDGSQLPTLIAADPSAIAISIDWSDHPAAPVFPSLDSALGTNVWQGRGIGFGHWWVPAKSYTDILNNRGRVLVGVVGIIIKYKSGDWRPLIMQFQHDPADARWRLLNVYQRESPNDLVVAWDY